LSKDRQRLGNRSGDGTKLVVTVNPSALLRIEDEKDKHAAYCDFVADLKAARLAAGKAAAPKRSTS
jgi:hypothetical protein